MADTKSNPNAQILEELEALSDTLYKSHTSATARRTASLVLPRNTPVPSIEDDDNDNHTAESYGESSNKPRSRRMSLSPWRSRSKLEDGISKTETKEVVAKTSTANLGENEKKGIWKWKPMRALSHIGMQKLSCLFSVEVVAAQDLPSSMNGLRLAVCVRKHETKDGAVKTMPSRVSQGAADFEETLFIKCHAYYSNNNHEKRRKFEPRPFLIYLFAVDAQELDFGRSYVDLSELIRESVEKSQQGSRVRQWDTSFELSGKAKGGELVVKLGFQIVEKDGGVDIYNNNSNTNSPMGNSKSSKLSSFSSSFARKQSKSSFSVPSPRMTSRSDAWSPSQAQQGASIQGMDDLNLDDPNPVHDSSSSAQKVDHDRIEQVEDFDLPDFEVVDKGIEVQEKEEDEGEESDKSVEEKPIADEVVKEVVHDHVHHARLSELDSIAQQIKALESMMGDDDMNNMMKIDEETDALEADEETVTREFLQMLEEDQDNKGYLFNQSEIPSLQLEEGRDNSPADGGESKVYLSELGKGLGCVVKTRDGGYLASMNPLDVAVARKDTPKLAMQMSKPYVLASHESMSGFDLFQKLAGIGLDELSSEVLSSLMPIDELIGKTAEQIAFEGIASTVVQGRNKEGASSSAARIVSALKSMSNIISSGRKERISTGLWNVDEDPVTSEKLLPFSMQKIESMTVEALKIQADVAEEEAPFDFSALSSKKGVSGKDLLASAIPVEDWIRDQSLGNNKGSATASSDGEPEKVTLILVVQLRDPMRRYETVGGPMMVLIHATHVGTDGAEEEKRFKVISMHVGGFKVRSSTKKNGWDNEKQRLTAMQWLVAYGLGKAGKKGKQAVAKGQDVLYSISSRVVADMWLKTIRNPDIKLVK
ncbi:protein PLASTID MOVEMENT IMPAIRED 1-like [Vicia villosa]|uniref:protein PLASTID MOVEMENT IMPAIRED 1-like n=1 Tax=Vicia villosa TaxID=3911 RepID=UPI00273C53DA|nr:protein PLASTID MOVEMENT IMPAIRED 1-like [Vicia villosa]